MSLFEYLMLIYMHTIESEMGGPMSILKCVRLVQGPSDRPRRKSGLPGRDVGSIPTRAHFFIVYSFHLARS